MNLITALRLELDPAHPDVVAFVGGGGKTTLLFRLAAEIAGRGRRVITTTTTRIFTGQIGQSPAHLVMSGGQIDWAQLSRQLDQHGQCLLITSAIGEKAEGIAPATVDSLVEALREQRRHLNVGAVLVEADGSRNRPVKAPAAHEPVLPETTNVLAPLFGLDGIGLAIAEPQMHRPERIRAALGLNENGVRLTPEMASRLITHPLGGAKGLRAGMRFLPFLNKADTAPRLASGRLVASRLAQKGYSSIVGAVGNSEADPVVERWGPTAAVILAAGTSRRMGRPKQLLEWRGQPLVVHAVKAAVDSRADQVIIVLGAHQQQIQAALAGAFDWHRGRVRVVNNPAWADGQSTSVLAALQALPDECQAVMFLPVDQPGLPSSLLRRMWRLWRQGYDRVAPQVDGQLRGAPAIFDRRFWPQLRKLTGDQGARPLLRTDRESIAPVTVREEWLADIDTPEDWMRFQDDDRLAK